MIDREATVLPVGVQLLFAKVEARASGELVAQGNVEVHVYLQQGRVAWGTTSADRQLFRRYVQFVFGVDPAVFHSVIDQCFRSRLPLADTLVRSGVLDAWQVRAALAEQARAAVHSLKHCERALFLPRGGVFDGYDRRFTFALGELNMSTGARDELPPASDAASIIEAAAWDEVAPLVVKKSPTARPVREGDVLVLVDVSRQMRHELNETGLRIWQQIDGRRTVDAIAFELLFLFPMIDVESLRSELVLFLDTLNQAHLIELE